MPKKMRQQFENHENKMWSLKEIQVFSDQEKNIVRASLLRAVAIPKPQEQTTPR